MALINFQKQFAEDVRSGKKTQTIRSPRKYPIKKGETLYLYTGLRTKNTEKLMEVECKDVKNVTIYEREFKTNRGSWYGYLDLDNIAKKDGFDEWASMIEWFKNTHGLPFKGKLIEW